MPFSPRGGDRSAWGGHPTCCEKRWRARMVFRVLCAWSGAVLLALLGLGTGLGAVAIGAISGLAAGWFAGWALQVGWDMFRGGGCGFCGGR